MKTKIFRLSDIELYCFGQDDAIERLSAFFEVQQQYKKIDMDALICRLPEDSICAFFKTEKKKSKRIVDEMNGLLRKQGNLTDDRQFFAAYMICHPEEIMEIRNDFNISLMKKDMV